MELPALEDIAGFFVVGGAFGALYPGWRETRTYEPASPGAFWACVMATFVGSAVVLWFGWAVSFAGEVRKVETRSRGGLAVDVRTPGGDRSIRLHRGDRTCHVGNRLHKSSASFEISCNDRAGRINPLSVVIPAATGPLFGIGAWIQRRRNWPHLRAKDRSG